VRADQAQIFATLDGQTLTLLSKPKPDVSIIRSVQVADQPLLPTQVIEQEIVWQQLHQPIVTVFSLNHLPSDLDVPKHWQLTDATIAQGENFQSKYFQERSTRCIDSVARSSASALLHLLMPIKRSKHKKRFEQWANYLLKRNKALNINFAKCNAQPMFSTSQLFAMSVLTFGLLFVNYAYLNEQVSLIQRQLDDASSQNMVCIDPQCASEVDEHQNKELADAKKIGTSLNLAWGQLFVAIEASMNADVTLLNITSNSSSGDLYVSGNARNFKSILTFVQALKDQWTQAQDLSLVYLSSHQLEEQNSLRSIRFAVNASLNPKAASLIDMGLSPPRPTDIKPEVLRQKSVGVLQTVARFESSK
jgi:hypothetical protein